jgi:uncharacterized protein
VAPGAETSSWQQRATTVPKAPTGKPPAKVKSQPLSSTAAPFDRPPTGFGGKAAGPAGRPTPNLSTHVKSTGGDDPAYDAFDQGRYLTALELARAAAERGEPQAHTLVGRIHGEGLGVPQDEAAAAQWYTKGAELGDLESAFALGVLLAEGRGVKKDQAAAARYFETAAAKGHALANYNLALLFLKGTGKPENPHRAYLHMTYAAEKGVVAAQYDLGTLYTTGTGVEPNAFEAAKWIGKAAGAGYTDAEVEYAIILFRGHGTPPDEKRAAGLLRTAADKGVVVAQNRLARCYVHGLGVEKNAVEAAKWHLIAKSGGIDDEMLEKAAAKLSRADRGRAQKAAEEWSERSAVQ